MNKFIKSCACVLMVGALAVGFAACQSSNEAEKEKTTSEVAGEYFLDLSNLGMNLTVYLSLSEYGEFILSGTLEFATDKGSGVFSKSGEEYLMSYTYLNNAEVTATDGYMSQFNVLDDGSLYFTSEYLYYGSTHISTVGEDDPTQHLIAVPISSDYKEPDTESDFALGVYTSTYQSEGREYNHSVSFFADNTYLQFVYFEEDGALKFLSEAGTYSVISNQLALVPYSDATSRNSCTVESATKLTLSVLAAPDKTEREDLEFTKAEQASQLAVFEGEIEGYAASLTLFSDGSYTAISNGVEENGVISINSAAGTFKQYPDSLTDGTRGLTQVSTVPEGKLSIENNKNKLENVRLRISATVYTRYSCTLTETEKE